MQVTESLSYTVSPDEYYAFDWKKVLDQEGYEPVGPMRHFKAGDTYLSSIAFILTAKEDLPSCAHPVLVLRKKQPKRWVFEECSKEEAAVLSASHWVRQVDGQILQLHRYRPQPGECYVRPAEEKS